MESKETTSLNEGGGVRLVVSTEQRVLAVTEPQDKPTGEGGRGRP